MNVIIKTGVGFNANEAKENADVEFTLIGNATMMWKKAGCPTGDALNEFIKEYLSKKNIPANKGYYIVVDAPSADKKMKPFRVVRTANKEQRVLKTTYQLVGKESRVVYAEVITNKIDEALMKAREIVPEKKETIELHYIKTVIAGVPVPAVVEYAPSIKSKIGSYILFGLPEEI